MTYDEIKGLEGSSVPGAFLIKLFNDYESLTHEIKVGKIRKKEQLTVVEWVGLTKSGIWARDSAQVFHIEKIEQISIKELLEIIAQNRRTINDIDIAKKIAEGIKMFPPFI